MVSASLDQTVRVWDIGGLRKKTVAPMGEEGLRLAQVCTRSGIRMRACERESQRERVRDTETDRASEVEREGMEAGSGRVQRGWRIKKWKIWL